MTAQAITIADAARRLEVSPQRVSQLLREERLEGPDYGPGRAPAKAERVWLASLAAYQRSRRSRPGPSRSKQLEARVEELERVVAELHASESSGADRIVGEIDSHATPGVSPRGEDRPSRAEAVRRSEARERAARQAAVVLKVAVDALQERLDVQLSRTLEVNQRAAELEALLESANARMEALSIANRGLTDSLSYLLGPDDPGDST